MQQNCPFFVGGLRPSFIAGGQRYFFVGAYEFWEGIGARSWGQHKLSGVKKPRALHRITDHELKRYMVEASKDLIFRHKKAVWTPSELAVRVLADLLKNCLPSASPDEKPSLINLDHMLREVTARIRADRRVGRPRKRSWELEEDENSVLDLKKRLQEIKRNEGQSYDYIFAYQ